MTNFTLLVLGTLILELASCSAALLHGRQYWPDSNPIVRTPQECNDISLTNPKWGIFGPVLVAVNSSSGGTQGDIGFLTVNSATGVAANCTAKNIELDPKEPDAVDVWHNCGIPDLSFQFNLESLDMRLKGSWLCDNSSSALKFAANGSWEVPLIQGCLDDWSAPRGQETLCIMGNSQVSAGLSTPVAIYPQLPLFPYTPRERAQRCVDRSYDPEWQLNDLFYHRHSVPTDNHTGLVYDLSLDLINISTGQEMNCSVTVDLSKNIANNGSAPWVRCMGFTTGAPDSTSNVTSVEVTLDIEYGVLGLRQAWECSDGISGVESNQFFAIGYTNISIECSGPSISGIYNNRDLFGATPDYSCKLSTSPATFTGYVDSAPLMPHTIYTRSCTIQSISNTTTMMLREYQLQSISTPDGTGRSSLVGSFALYNPGPGDTYRLYQIPVSDDGAWHECIAGSEPLPWQLVGCKYLLDRQNHRISFQVQWYCDDRDPSHAILFNATVAQQLPAEVCEKRDGREICEVALSVTELAMPVSSLTWKTATGSMDRGPTLPWI